MDVRITFPRLGFIQVDGALFADSSSEACKRFVSCAFEVEAIQQVLVTGGRRSRVMLSYAAQKASPREIVAQIAKNLARQPLASHSATGHESPDNGVSTAASLGPVAQPLAGAVDSLLARDRRGAMRLERHEGRVSGWCIVKESPGRVTLRHPVLHRKADVAQ
ncbi:MAG: hypothetical protein WCQ91_08385, partial [Planctomycetota bacterium]